MQLKNMQTFNEEFLRHHARVALEYIRLVEKETRKAGHSGRLWFRDWQQEITKSTIL